jgi:hypothetical protein
MKPIIIKLTNNGWLVLSGDKIHGFSNIEKLQAALPWLLQQTPDETQSSSEQHLESAKKAVEDSESEARAHHFPHGGALPICEPT